MTEVEEERKQQQQQQQQQQQEKDDEEVSLLLLKAKVKYLAKAENDDETGTNTAVYYASQPGVEQAKEHDGQFRYEQVLVHNGRSTPMNWNIDKEGFQLLDNIETEVNDFYNDKEVKDIFYPEVTRLLLKNIPGNPTRVVIFDHTRRASTSELRKEKNVREPSAIVHNDYTSKSATKRLKDILGEETTTPGEQQRQRFAIVNLWRSICADKTCVIKSAPMAFCDSTSINTQQDLVSVKRVAADRIGELQMSLFSPQHQWYYFPFMTTNEALIFKTYDSDPTVNQFTLHTALLSSENDDDESNNITPPPPPRESIEIRAFVFF